MLGCRGSSNGFKKLLTSKTTGHIIVRMNKREQKKEEILLAGMSVMKESGYNGTSVKDIVDAAGVPKGSFYNYFDSKESFALDAIDFAANDGRGYAEAVLKASDVAPLERLMNFFKSGTDCACEHEFKVGCFIGNMCQEMADSSERIRCKLDQVLNGNTRMIASVIEEGQSDGTISSSGDAKMLAEFLFNAWEGALMRAKAAKSRTPLDAFLKMLVEILE